MKNNKELIKQYDLRSLVDEWLKTFADGRSHHMGKNHVNRTTYDNSFNWYLDDIDGSQYSVAGAVLHNEHWDIHNDFYKEENVNIKIFNDHIEFIEDSKFRDFSKEEMYSLYTFLGEKMFGVNTIINSIDDRIYNNVIREDKLATFWCKRILPKITSSFEKIGVGKYRYKSSEGDEEANLIFDSEIRFRVENNDGDNISVRISHTGIERCGLNSYLHSEFIRSLTCDEETKTFIAGMIDCL